MSGFAEVDDADCCLSCGKEPGRCGCYRCETCDVALKPDQRDDGLCFGCNKERLWAEAAKTDACSGCGCKPEDGCPCARACNDEGSYCERHFAAEKARRFG